MVSEDDKKRSTELTFPGGVTAEIAMARTEKFTKSGAKPQITAASIHEDLLCRDFTVNAIALSLNKASLGLLVDPGNGMGDIERKELRTLHNYSFYDDPGRLLRLFRFKVRLGYNLDERTRSQVENAIEAGLLERVSMEALGAELRQMARENAPHDVVKALEEEKLLSLFSPALATGKIDYTILGKLQKVLQSVPFGIDFQIDYLPLFLEALFTKLAAKDSAAVIKNTGLTRAESNALSKLAPAAKKLEKPCRAPSYRRLRPSINCCRTRPANKSSTWPSIPPSAWCRIASRIISRNTCRCRRRSPTKWWPPPASRPDRPSSPRPRRI
ncbi:MAG: hypothetical protein WDO18_05090 [Acidobacteriota bacterium]